ASRRAAVGTRAQSAVRRLSGLVAVLERGRADRRHGRARAVDRGGVGAGTRAGRGPSGAADAGGGGIRRRAGRDAQTDRPADAAVRGGRAVGNVSGETAQPDPPVAKGGSRGAVRSGGAGRDRKSTRLNSSHVAISYAVFC